MPHDPLHEQLLARERLKSGALAGGASAKIGPKPEPSTPRKILEMITGYPADPERDMTPMDAIQMMLMGTGAAKAAGKGFKALRDIPDAKPGEIAQDPYGVANKITRRQLFDRAQGNPAVRADEASLDAYLKAERHAPFPAVPDDAAENAHFTALETFMPKGVNERLGREMEYHMDPFHVYGKHDTTPGPVGTLMDSLMKRLKSEKGVMNIERGGVGVTDDLPWTGPAG